MRKSRKMLAWRLLAAAVLIVTLTGCQTAESTFATGRFESGSSSKKAKPDVEYSADPQNYSAPAGEMKAIWVSTAWGGDFPKTGGSSSQKKELQKLVADAKEAGFNTIVFQVRTWSDALYQSSVFPWSAILTGTQGRNPGYDPLAYLIGQAHAKGIKVQAWINPYRIYSSTSPSKTTPCSLNPALNPKYPTYTYSYNGKTYKIYDPASQNVRDLITSGVTEIIRNYDIDGIQFDDYFYPTAPTFDDSESYQSYQSGGGKLSLSDWRRENVTSLIRQVHTAVHSEANGHADFGISPSGIYRNISYSTKDGGVKSTNGSEAYSELYADVRLWVENHWIDYVCPQIYWGFNNQKAPYAPICDWWVNLCEKNSVKLYIGLSGDIVTGGEGVWTDSAGMNQVQYARGRGSGGFMVFHSAQLPSLSKELKGLFM